MARHEGRVKKGWGEEVIFATNDLYCGKLLKMKPGKEMSMHFHLKKHETWYVLGGEFLLKKINTEVGEGMAKTIQKGAVIVNEPGEPHRLHCLKEGTIIEVSTPDSVEDNYRVQKGDSQK
tara:strand:- start:203 stop:562 length:360 start_codon:yes stop_codon:yes gene_type:complete